MLKIGKDMVKIGHLIYVNTLQTHKNARMGINVLMLTPELSSYTNMIPINENSAHTILMESQNANMEIFVRSLIAKKIYRLNSYITTNMMKIFISFIIKLFSVLLI